MNAMERIDVDAAAQVTDEDIEDITIPEIGGALSEIAVKLDQFGHPTIADELRVLGAHLVDLVIIMGKRMGNVKVSRKLQ